MILATGATRSRVRQAVVELTRHIYPGERTAASDESAYRADWWRRRAWAKTWLGETERFAWWELVDRWRYGPIKEA